VDPEATLAAVKEYVSVVPESVAMPPAIPDGEIAPTIGVPAVPEGMVNVTEESVAVAEIPNE
jgi:hypothetical protein